MREYRMAPDAVLDLPLKMFWFMTNQIDRLRAEEDMRQIQLLGASQDSDAFKMALDSLKSEMGQVYIWQPSNSPTEIRIDPTTGLDPEFDREGLMALKAMSRQMAGEVQ